MSIGTIKAKIDKCLENPKVMTKDVTEMAALLYEIKAFLETLPPITTGGIK